MPVSAPPASRVLIVGAGFSGATTAVHLLRGAAAAPGDLEVILVERRSRFGRGLAYHTWDDNLLLNVPAGNMSALADDPGHFVAYLSEVDPAFNAASFVSRRIYGDYLEQTLRTAERAGKARLTRLVGEVEAVRRRAGGGLAVSLADGKSCDVDGVVLALGHFPPLDPPPLGEFFASASYVANPWDFDALDRIDPARPVALLGAGHTAVDALFRLTSTSDRRKVYLISRRGLLTHGHRFTPKPPGPNPPYPPYLTGVPDTVRAYTRAIRRAAERKLDAGEDWRDVMNALRPHTAAMWQRLPLAEQRKFLTRIVPFWDIHRHRLAPAAYLRLQQMLGSGQVECVTGRVQAFEPDGEETRIHIRAPRTGAVRELKVAAVVNCTGPNYDIKMLDIPLLAQLERDGMIRQDPLKLGLDVDADYRVIGRGGTAAPDVYYIGPMLKARYWEAIAIPELRGHAVKLARILGSAFAPT
jgi:uncharacterized NAD(P)/FAD-binding protein YdhS